MSKKYPLRLVGLHYDEGRCYVSKGHHEVDAFRLEVSRIRRDEVSIDWPVRHAHRRVVPDPDGGEIWIPAKPGSRGSFPVTMLCEYETDDEGEPT